MDQAGSETPLWRDIAMAHSPDAMSSLSVRLNAIAGASSHRTDDIYPFSDNPLMLLMQLGLQ